MSSFWHAERFADTKSRDLRKTSAIQTSDFIFSCFLDSSSIAIEIRLLRFSLLSFISLKLLDIPKPQHSYTHTYLHTRMYKK